MGRGRAKAKQTKVARELKYHSPSTNFDSLQRELSGSGTSTRLGGFTERAESSSRWDDDDEDDGYENWRRA